MHARARFAVVGLQAVCARVHTTSTFISCIACARRNSRALDGTRCKRTVAIILRFGTSINPIVASTTRETSAARANKSRRYIDAATTVVAWTSLALVDIYGAVFSLIPGPLAVAMVGIHVVGARTVSARSRCALVHVCITCWARKASQTRTCKRLQSVDTSRVICARIICAFVDVFFTQVPFPPVRALAREGVCITRDARAMFTWTRLTFDATFTHHVWACT